MKDKEENAQNKRTRKISVDYLSLGRGYSENIEGILLRGSCGKSLAYHHEGPGSIPGQFMMNVWRIKCNLDR